MHDIDLRAAPAPDFCRARGERIRPFQPQDRAAVRRLCCDNGYLGAPIDAAFGDRALFAALYIDPYLDHYPDWTFIAECDGDIVGYLTAATGWRCLAARLKCGCAASWRLLARKAGGADEKFLRWLLLRSWRERVSRPRTPVHMHFCIRSGYRGRYLAQRLWGAFEAKLRAHGIRHYYGEAITARPRQVARAYERYGLSLYAQTRSTMFAHIDERQVWNVCITK